MYTAPNVIMLYHHAKLEDDRMLSLIESGLMIFCSKYANELINIHEYAGNVTQKYTAPEVIVLYRHAKLEDDRMLGLSSRVD